VLIPSARAEVPISAANHVRNRSGRACGWCALETLARHHRLEALYGLADKHTGPSRPRDLEAALDDAGINYRVQPAGNRNTFILRYAVREKLGALVGFHPLKPGADRHMVTLVDIGPDKVRVIDPNDSDGRVRTMSLKRFLSWWDGFTLIVEPEEAE
jgi:ABC-type bacteriocin/lantibiotic exporter with double-glycine peptidase domain